MLLIIKLSVKTGLAHFMKYKRGHLTKMLNIKMKTSINMHLYLLNDFSLIALL